jgi:hypothetical protein
MSLHEGIAARLTCMVYLQNMPGGTRPRLMGLSMKRDRLSNYLQQLLIDDDENLLLLNNYTKILSYYNNKESFI